MIKVNIYVLIDPISNKIRYIGRTKNSLKVRLNGHISKSLRNKNKTHKDNWILKLRNLELKPICKLLEIVEGWEESYQREQFLIKSYLEEGYDLVNSHDRGEGGLLRNISKEQKIKISNSIIKLHKEGKFSCNRKILYLYDLEGTFIRQFESYKKCAQFIAVSEKHLQSSIKREDSKIRNFQVRKTQESIPGLWEPKSRSFEKNYKEVYVYDLLNKEELYFNSRKELSNYFNSSYTSLLYYIDKEKLYLQRYKISNARLKLDELLENLEEDNQQPS